MHGTSLALIPGAADRQIGNSGAETDAMQRLIEGGGLIDTCSGPMMPGLINGQLHSLQASGEAPGRHD
jgi:hypothetical protein